MENKAFRQKQVVRLRNFRTVHRYTGIGLFLFLTIVGISGLMLGWKKNSGGLILANTAKGTSTDLKEWLGLDSLTYLTQMYMSDSLSLGDAILDRMDVRPDKGVIKYSFSNYYTGIQIDAATGQILKVEQRYSDLIEHIHDGSWVDRQLGFDSGVFKLIFTSVAGVGLLTFCITGFWLWYGPKVLKRY